MTNKEAYKQAFSALHTSDNFPLEVEKMKKASKQQKIKTLVASAAACVIIAGSTTVAYATDLGGIQRTLQLWLQGDQTEVTIMFDGEGSYTMDYLDDDGNAMHQGGGGVALNEDGTSTPLSEEELLAQLMAPTVQYEDDGSVWVYWFDQKIDITDKFTNDVCYVQLVNGKERIYMTIEYQNGHSTSPHKFPEPSLAE